MNAELKSIWIDEDHRSFLDYVPQNPTEVGVWVNLKIGIANELGADDFRVFVCTTDWLSANCTEHGKWGRHLLIFNIFSAPAVIARLDELIRRYDGKEWSEIALRISRFAEWEFEDYSA